MIAINHKKLDTLFPTGRLLAIFLLAWLSLFAGINTIPLEQHEAYVVQTSREMGVTGDLVLPYFNQQPRLNKPPLNYWLTLGISTLDPFSSDVQPWHGRIWSLTGALLLVLMTAFIGNKLYGGPVGFLASALLLASKGFTAFSNDARPDFLYSALCVLQLFAWIAAWRSEDDSNSQRGYAAAGWVLAALATLSKGPQVPAVFLLGFILFLIFDSERTRLFKVLRPFIGMVILLAMTVPWWMLLQERIKAIGLDISGTQLSGSLLVDASVRKGNLFYISRLLDFLLPVSLLLPLLAYLNRKRFSKPLNFSRLLLFVILTFLVVFTIAGHQRSRYLLPLLPLAALLLASPATRTSGDGIPGKLWQWLFWLATSAVVTVSALLIIKQQFASGLLLAGTGFILVMLLRKELQQQIWRAHPFAGHLIAISLLCTVVFAGCNVYWIHPNRVFDRDFSLSVGRVLHPVDLLTTMGYYPAVLPYYTGHFVAGVSGINQLKDAYADKRPGSNFYLLVPQEKVAELQEVFEITTLLTLAGNRDKDEKIVLAKITGEF